MHMLHLILIKKYTKKKLRRLRKIIKYRNRLLNVVSEYKLVQNNIY